MPELPEVEAYRSALSRLLPDKVARAEARHPYDARSGGWAVEDHLPGTRLAGVRRHGKVLVIDLEGEEGARPSVLALRFGMSGVLCVDGQPTIDALHFGPRRFDPSWLRLWVELDGGHTFAVSDPRGLGRAQVDPDLGTLGPDATEITAASFAERVRRRRASLKAVLLDQAVVAGVGNLLADEALWRAGLPPALPANLLDAADVERLARALRQCVEDAIAAGGSHRGPLVPERRPGGRCPADGTPLVGDRIGLRSTWWCPLHQRRGVPAPDQTGPGPAGSG